MLPKLAGTAPLVVGGPVRGRGWVLPRWFEHVFAACEKANIEPEFIFVVGHEDLETQHLLVELAADAQIELILSDEPTTPDRRVWNMDRYRHMTDLRNRLLRRVRELAPDMFLSLDSDLLLEPAALQVAIPQLTNYAALGFKTYMTPMGTDCTSHAQLVNGMLRNRQDAPEGHYVTDVIMAAKLMTELAYWIDYEAHSQGEDVGWCEACGRAGLKLGWSADARAKHVMAPDLLDAIDPRLGW